MFSVLTTREKLKKQQSLANLDFGVWWRLGQENHIIMMSSFSKMFFMYVRVLNRKAGVSKFLRHKERLRKAPFSWRISVDGTSNRRNKAAFSNFSGLMGTGPKYFPTSYHGVITTWYYVIISSGSINVVLFKAGVNTNRVKFKVIIKREFIELKGVGNTSRQLTTPKESPRLVGDCLVSVY